MVADPGYDDQQLYDLSMAKDFSSSVLLEDTKGHQKKE
jgi:hypothetical protein